MKIAVVMYNLGGPCCPQGIHPFLLNLFSDKFIINLPNPFRNWLARFISWRRTPKARGIYSHMGGGSPILSQTYAQAQALESQLGEGFKVFIYMRYSYPFVEDAMREVALYGAEKVILLPLYPQYSTTTTTSSEELWQQEIQRANMTQGHVYISDYPDHPMFAKAYAELLAQTLMECQHSNPIVLFSAHGIPLNRIEAGDPYEQHVHRSVEAILKETNRSDLEYRICYQSKVGPLKWLEPSTERLIEEYSKQGRSIVVLPVAFVSEHSETLVELDIEYYELAISHGAVEYLRVPAVGTHPAYIECLKQLVLESI